MAFYIAISIVGYTLFLVGMIFLFWPAKAFGTKSDMNLAKSLGYGLWALSSVQDAYVVYQAWNDGSLLPLTWMSFLHLLILGLTPIFVWSSVKFYRQHRVSA